MDDSPGPLRPCPGGASAQAVQSVAAHVLTLHGVLDRSVAEAHARWITGPAIRRRSVFRKLEPPPLGSALTIRHLFSGGGVRAWPEGRRGTRMSPSTTTSARREGRKRVRIALSRAAAPGCTLTSRATARALLRPSDAGRPNKAGHIPDRFARLVRSLCVSLSLRAGAAAQDSKGHRRPPPRGRPKSPLASRPTESREPRRASSVRVPSSRTELRRSNTGVEARCHWWRRTARCASGR